MRSGPHGCSSYRRIDVLPDEAVKVPGAMGCSIQLLMVIRPFSLEMRW
jgi:hypothetical protein